MKQLLTRNSTWKSDINAATLRTSFNKDNGTIKLRATTYDIDCIIKYHILKTNDALTLNNFSSVEKKASAVCSGFWPNADFSSCKPGPTMPLS